MFLFVGDSNVGAEVNEMPVASQSRDRTEPAGENESPPLRQQKQNICLPTNVLFLFIQAAGLAYHPTQVGISSAPLGLYLITR